MASQENPAAFLGRKGGKATAANRTPAERADAARHAVTERWRQTRERAKKAKRKAAAK